MTESKYECQVCGEKFKGKDRDNCPRCGSSNLSITSNKMANPEEMRHTGPAKTKEDDE